MNDEQFEKLAELATDYSRAKYMVMLLRETRADFECGTICPTEVDLADADAEEIKAEGLKKEILALIKTPLEK